MRDERDEAFEEEEAQRRDARDRADRAAEKASLSVVQSPPTREYGHVMADEECMACGKSYAECDHKYEPCPEQKKARSLVVEMGLFDYRPQDWLPRRG